MILLLVSVLLVSSFMLTGCMDLGAFEDGDEEGYADYYDTFGGVIAIYNGGYHTYDVEDDLFNEDTVNNMECNVESENYAYIVIPVERDFIIESLALFVTAEEENLLTVKAYFLHDSADVPFHFTAYDDDPEEESDPEDPPKQDVDPDLSIADATCSCAPGVFDSFMLTFRDEEGRKGLPVEDGDYILLCIENNTGSGAKKGMTPSSFMFTNFLVRAAG